MVNMGTYNIWKDKLSDYLEKQGARLDPWWCEMYEKCLRSALLLNVFGFMDEKEMKRIMNVITVRIILEAKYE